jgi:hypothetical protein
MSERGYTQRPTATRTPVPATMAWPRPLPSAFTAASVETEVQPDLQTQLAMAQRMQVNWSQMRIGGTPSVVQPKLTVGAPGDRYEQEADRVADQVMSMPDAATPSPIQREAADEEELQTKPLAAAITPLVQREMTPEEEELQAKPLGNGTLQREAMPEEEEAVQTKGSPDAALSAGSNLESRLSSSQGGGSPLPEEVRTFMEPRFGADFSQVRVHTGSESVQMNRDLNAQAFTHKQDVYFGAGKAPGKDALTAHELTHVVQQTGAVQTKNKPNLQQKCSECEKEDATLSRKAQGSLPIIQRKIGDGHDLTSPRFAGDEVLEACFDGEQNQYLRNGARGESVAKVQQAIVDLGYPLPKFGVDGLYGNETGAAVSSFKQDNDIMPADPVVGTKTMAGLDRRFETQVPPHPCPTGTIRGFNDGGGEVCQVTKPPPKFRVMQVDPNPSKLVSVDPPVDKKIDTHAKRSQFRWDALIQLLGESDSSFEVGFLQNVIQNSVVATYTTEDNSQMGQCSFVISKLPIRDGLRDDTWFRPRSFVLNKNTATQRISMDDRPGGYFNIEHPSDPKLHLRTITEDIGFHTWIAVREQNKPSNDERSYIFFRNVGWSINRTITLSKPLPGSLMRPSLVRDEAPASNVLSGKGAFKPNLDSDTVNDVVEKQCNSSK